MILAQAGKYIVAGSIALVAAAAQADVMEVDSNGARWIAGGTPAAAPAALEMTAAQRDALALADPQPMVPASSYPQITALGVPPRYAAKVQEISLRYNLSPRLIEALVWQESRWRENAVSPAGARGLAQLMPGTARYLGVNPDDPEANLEGGARYLREQLNTFDGDLEKALAAYNAGPGRVIRAGGIPNIRETRNYVAAIMGRLANQARPAGQ